MNDIQVRVNRCFSNVFPDIRDEQLPTASSTTLAAWDSMGHVRLLGAVEEEFGLQLEMEDFDELTSYPLIVDYVEKKSLHE